MTWDEFDIPPPDEDPPSRTETFLIPAVILMKWAAILVWIGVLLNLLTYPAQ